MYACDHKNESESVMGLGPNIEMLCSLEILKLKENPRLVPKTKPIG